MREQFSNLTFSGATFTMAQEFTLPHPSTSLNPEQGVLDHHVPQGTLSPNNLGIPWPGGECCFFLRRKVPRCCGSVPGSPNTMRKTTVVFYFGKATGNSCHWCSFTAPIKHAVPCLFARGSLWWVVLTILNPPAGWSCLPLFIVRVWESPSF